MTYKIIKPTILKATILKPGQPYPYRKPLQEGAAEGSSQLDTQQRAGVIGEVIPIVFCRRIGDIGGVLISPPATEARFEDAANGDVTASYHLVLSEGRIDSIQVRDVFQRTCRVGSFTQTYNRRAGTFVPGNFIDNSPDLEVPIYCGSGGSYAGMSTMAFSSTTPAGFDYWNRQVHCFVRGGMWVTRLLDGVTGPSNNVADLTNYLLQQSSLVPASQIDTVSLLAAATFTDVNGFWFNGVEEASRNMRDWMAETLPYFLLREARVQGKEGLRPLLPTTAAGAIDTSAVSWVWTFTEEHVQPDGFEISYTPLADRKPFCVVVLWRQQPTDDIGLIRSTEVRYTGTAETGPFEQHDLSRFCASEDHAVKVGTYILARRKHITHTLSLRVRPSTFNGTLVPGDLVRVRLNRVPSSGAASVHDDLYEVDDISKSITGDVQLQLTQFPVDSQLRSVVALEVASAQGSGILLPTAKTGVSCDTNSSTDTSVPADTGSNYVPDNNVINGSQAIITEIDALTLEAIASGGGGGGGGLPSDNPEDPLDNPEDPYQDWPEDFPRPTDPEWPSNMATSADPSSGNGWVEPVVIPPELMQPQAGYRLRVDYVGPYQASSNPTNCQLSSPLHTGEFSDTFNLGVLKGGFWEYGGEGACKGYGYIGYWRFWYVYSSKNFSIRANGDRRYDGLLITTPGSVTFTKVPI